LIVKYRCISTYNLITSFTLLLYLALSFIPAHAKYHPKEYSTLPFPPDVQTRKRLGEDTHKLKEENTKLEGMVESHDELIMEIAKGDWT
jgi:hypothetical protein